MICAVLYADTIEGLEEQANKAINHEVQIIEYRLDGLQEINIEEVKELLAKIRKPSILSVRSEWNNQLIPPPQQGRRELLGQLLELRPDYIDLEYPIDMPVLKEVQDPTKVILSMLDFEGMSKIAIDSLIKIALENSEITTKISATPSSVEDVKQLWRWANRFNKLKIKHVIIGMKQLGQITRIKSRELGNTWTYGRIDTKIGEPFLPGMLDILSLRNSFSDEAWHLGALGDLPEYHILPKIYTKILENAGLKGIFLNIPIKTNPELDQMLLWIDDGLLDGVYISPLWQNHVRSKLNRVDASVIWTGSCNCVAITKDGITGYNTEIEGIKRCLEPYSIKRFKRIYVEGTGRISRALIAAIKDSAELIVVRNKDQQRFNTLKNDFPTIISAKDSFTEHFDLIVNCTKPEVGFENVITIPPQIIRNAKLIFDVADNGISRSALSNKAHILDIPTINTWQLFVNSMIKSFELWTKRSIPSSSIKMADFIGEGQNNKLDFFLDE